MSFNIAIQPTQLAVAVTAFTGAAPQTVTGTTIAMDQVDKGTLSANVYALATTNTLTVTAKWQVSDDAVTFRDAYGPNRATNVAIATGTGSAVTDTICITAPDAVYAKRYARLVCVSGTGSGGGLGVDEASISYNWRKPFILAP